MHPPALSRHNATEQGASPVNNVRFPQRQQPSKFRKTTQIQVQSPCVATRKRIISALLCRAVTMMALQPRHRRAPSVVGCPRAAMGGGSERGREGKREGGREEDIHSRERGAASNTARCPSCSRTTRAGRRRRGGIPGAGANHRVCQSVSPSVQGAPCNFWF